MSASTRWRASAAAVAARSVTNLTLERMATAALPRASSFAGERRLVPAAGTEPWTTTGRPARGELDDALRGLGGQGRLVVDDKRLVRGGVGKETAGADVSGVEKGSCADGVPGVPGVRQRLAEVVRRMLTESRTTAPARPT